MRISLPFISWADGDGLSIPCCVDSKRCSRGQAEKPYFLALRKEEAMGREAECACAWGPVTVQVKVLLEAREMILRGGIRRRLPLTGAGTGAGPWGGAHLSLLWRGGGSCRWARPRRRSGLQRSKRPRRAWRGSWGSRARRPFCCWAKRMTKRWRWRWARRNRCPGVTGS